MAVEPFSVFVIVSRFGKWLARPVVSVWRNFIENRDLLVFGQNQTGKSSLINFLTTGSPLQPDGSRPDRTTWAVATTNPQLLELVKNKINKRERIRKDVGGDGFHSGDWQEMIRDINPHGIIYLIDCTKTNEVIIESIDRIFTEILPEYSGDRRRLRAFHIFVSFYDVLIKLENGYQRANSVRDMVDNYFTAKFKKDTYKHIYPHIKLRIVLVHLNPEEKKWNELKNALTAFGTDIRQW